MVRAGSKRPVFRDLSQGQVLCSRFATMAVAKM
jgi:hypothetical protein